MRPRSPNLMSWAGHTDHVESLSPEAAGRTSDSRRT